MLNSLCELGKLWKEKEDLDDIEVLVDEVQLSKSTKYVIIIELTWDNENSIEFNRVFKVEYNPINNLKYLYKKGAANNKPYILPCALISSKEKAKVRSTFKSKILQWFDEYSDDELLVNVGVCLNNNDDEISKDITDKFMEIESKNRDNVLLTLRFIRNNEPFYLGDIDIFKEYFIKNSFERYGGETDKPKGEGTCLLCGGHCEVFGTVTNTIGFGFSTPEKQGNIQGLNIDNQWKQVPICKDCAIYLEAGKKFVETYMSFSEFGLKYLVIPNFLLESDTSFDIFYELITFIDSENSYEEVSSLEKDFNEMISELNDILEFKFLFYGIDNKSFDILFYVESSLPSWLNKIYNFQGEIKDYSIFSEDVLKEVYGKDATGNLNDWLIEKKYNLIKPKNWYLSFLRDFLSPWDNTKKKYFYNKRFFEIVESVICGKPIDLDYLMFCFMNRLRSDWKNGNFKLFYLNVLKSLALIFLFDKLNLIKGGNSVVFDTDDIDVESVVNSLDSYDKKSSFYLGILTRYLVSVQYARSNSVSFKRKLWDFSLNEKRIKTLYKDVIAKLNQYGVTYSDLEAIISYNLSNSDGNWKLNKDETSYYFVLGYTLAKIFKEKSDEDKEKPNVETQNEEVEQ